MNHIAQDDDEKCILKTGSREAEEKRQTQNHAWNRIGDQSDSLDDFFQLSAQLTSGSDQSAAVHQKSSENSGVYRRIQGIEINGGKLCILKYIEHIFKRELDLIRPLLPQKE